MVIELCPRLLSDVGETHTVLHQRRNAANRGSGRGAASPSSGPSRLQRGRLCRRLVTLQAFDELRGEVHTPIGISEHLHDIRVHPETAGLGVTSLVLLRCRQHHADRFAIWFFGHGVAHLHGFLVSWRLRSFHELPYRTAIFGNTADVGSLGMRVIGVGWLLGGVALVALGGAGALSGDRLARCRVRRPRTLADSLHPRLAGCTYRCRREHRRRHAAVREQTMGLAVGRPGRPEACR